MAQKEALVLCFSIKPLQHLFVLGPSIGDFIFSVETLQINLVPIVALDLIHNDLHLGLYVMSFSFRPSTHTLGSSEEQRSNSNCWCTAKRLRSGRASLQRKRRGQKPTGRKPSSRSSRGWKMKMLPSESTGDGQSAEEAHQVKGMF